MNIIRYINLKSNADRPLNSLPFRCVQCCHFFSEWASKGIPPQACPKCGRVVDQLEHDDIKYLYPFERA